MLYPHDLMPVHNVNVAFYVILKCMPILWYFVPFYAFENIRPNTFSVGYTREESHFPSRMSEALLFHRASGRQFPFHKLISILFLYGNMFT